MKHLYKILVEHYAPKGSHESVETYLYAEDDEAVYNWIDKNAYGWDDEDDGETFDVYGEDGTDDEYNVIGQETYKQKMIRIGGNMYDDDLDLTDAYYGVIVFGWKQLSQFVPHEEILAMADLGIDIKETQ